MRFGRRILPMLSALVGLGASMPVAAPHPRAAHRDGPPLPRPPKFRQVPKNSFKTGKPALLDYGRPVIATARRAKLRTAEQKRRARVRA